MPGCTQWAAFEWRPATVWSEWEVCLLLWKTENGSYLMDAARSTRAPSIAVVVKCSLLDWHFQVQIVWMLQQAERQCSGHFSSLLMDRCWLLLRARPCLSLCWTDFRTTMAPCHLCSPMWPCVPLCCPFPALNPPLPSSHYHSGCRLVQTGGSSCVPRSF